MALFRLSLVPLTEQGFVGVWGRPRGENPTLVLFRPAGEYQ